MALELSRKPADCAYPSWLVVALAALVVALTGVPSIPFTMGPGIDYGWVMGLNMAHALGLKPGVDLIWSYGPLGYLTYPDPAFTSATLALGFRLAVFAIWIAALVRLLRALPSRASALSAAGVFAIAAVAIPAWPLDQLELAILTLALSALARGSRLPSPELYALSALAGVAALVKANIAMESAGLLVVSLGMGLWRSRPLARGGWRHTAAALLLWPATAIALYATETGGLSSFGAYVRQSLEVASSYPESQAEAGPLWPAALAVISLAALFAGVPLLAEKARALAPAAVPAALVCFFYFKHAFVCEDAHVVTFQARLALAAMFPFVCAATTRDRRVLALLQFASVAMGVAIVFEWLPQSRADILGRLKLTAAADSARGYWRAFTDWQGLRAQGDAELARMRLPERFHRTIGSGSVDAVPWDVALVRANNWRWAPRPVFQSYSVQSGALDRVNAEHLRGLGAADFVLLHWNPVRGRHPFFEDPLSWQVLLDRYELEMDEAPAMLLRRRDVARIGAARQFSETQAHLGEAIPVPPRDEMVLIAADIRPSLEGSLRNALFRIDPLYFEATYESGEKVRWRVIRTALRAGAIISPLPKGLTDLASILRGNRRGLERVRSIRFFAERPSQYDARIAVRWLALPWPVFSPAPPDASPRTPLWISNGPMTPPRAKRPDLRVDLNAAPAQHNALAIRAWFPDPGPVRVSFGGGKALEGYAPQGGLWYEIRVHVARSPAWKAETGNVLQLEPATADLSGVWSAMETDAAGRPDLEFSPLPAVVSPP